MAEEKTLEDLLDYLSRKKSLDDVDRYIPNWKNLIQDPSNFPRLCEFELDYLSVDVPTILEIYSRILDLAGMDLAMLWSGSDNSFKKWVAEDYFRRFSRPAEITAEVWKNLSRKAKLQIICNVFESNPGEPFHFLKQIYYDLTSPDTIQFKRHRDVVLWFPSIGYVPSVEVFHLRSVIEQAGDAEFLQIIDSTIARYSQACERLTLFEGVLRYLYTFSSDERELIARALEPFLKEGFSLAPLPPVFISFEPPPLFIGFPQLDMSLDKKVSLPFRIEELVREPQTGLIPPSRSFIPRAGQRKKPDRVAIEDILGYYRPCPEPKFIIFYDGLEWFGQDEVFLRYLTVLHLSAHWIAQALPCEEAPVWPQEKYLSTSREVQETIAQLITYWVVETVGGELKKAFDKLNGYLTGDYLKFKDFVRVDKGKIIASIKELRKADRPVMLADWKNLLNTGEKSKRRR